MPKIFLHIGANKTGTTAIQHFLHVNAGTLRRRGILYPETGRGDPGAGEMLHYNLAASLGYRAGGRSSNPARKDAATLKSELLDEMATVKCDRVVISSESFMLRRDASKVAEFFAGFDISVIVYLRRHDKWLESLLTQAIKTVPRPPWELGLEGYLAHQEKINGQYLDYLDLLRHWAAAFGKERIIVRPFEVRQNRPNIVADFLDAIGADSAHSGLISGDTIFNASLPGKALMLIDMVNRSRLPERFRRYLVRQTIAEFKDTKSVSILSPELRRSLAQRYCKDYEIIAREYLGRPDGRLFFDALCDRDDAYEPLTAPGIMDVARFAFRMLARAPRMKR